MTARSAAPAAPAAAGTKVTVVVLLAGICAALHVAKLPPALPVLQASLGLTLVQAGFLLSMVQAIGMLLGVAIGSVADALGARRSMLAGAVLMAACSAGGALAPGLPALLLLRTLEGLAFMLVALPGPGWLRAQLSPAQLGTAMAWWSTYMPAATAMALAVGPTFTHAVGWRAWWWLMAAASALSAVALWRTPGPALPGTAWQLDAWRRRLGAALRETLRAPGPWLLAGLFALYALQWLAVVGFLPTLVLQTGLGTGLTGALTAAVAAINIVGNLASGRLLRRGATPARLVTAALLAMAAGAALLFAAEPRALRLAGALLFSACGGLIPGTLFALTVRVAPSQQTMATTVGWMMQGSALGQFCGPPAVAWAASAGGHWGWAALVTAGAALLALCLVAPLQCALVRH